MRTVCLKSASVNRICSVNKIPNLFANQADISVIMMVIAEVSDCPMRRGGGDTVRRLYLDECQDFRENARSKSISRAKEKDRR